MLKRFYLFITFAFTITAVSAQALKDEIPELNGKVLKYVNSVIGKKVDRGECWDLAKRALEAADATWDHKFTYGKPLNPEKDSIYAGDMIQFYNVKLKYVKDGIRYQETMTQHTAIVYHVKKQGVFEIAQQNTGGRSGKKVSIDPLDLSTVVKGKLKFYRPVK